MKSQFNKAYRRWGPTILAITAMVLVAYNAAMIYHASRLSSAIRDYSARNRELEDELFANEHLRRRVVEVNKTLGKKSK